VALRQAAVPIVSSAYSQKARQAYEQGKQVEAEQSALQAAHAADLETLNKIDQQIAKTAIDRVKQLTDTIESQRKILDDQGNLAAKYAEMDMKQKQSEAQIKQLDFQNKNLQAQMDSTKARDDREADERKAARIESAAKAAEEKEKRDRDQALASHKAGVDTEVAISKMVKELMANSDLTEEEAHSIAEKRIRRMTPILPSPARPEPMLNVAKK
jgi:hypothetical protein